MRSIEAFMNLTKIAYEKFKGLRNIEVENKEKNEEIVWEKMEIAFTCFCITGAVYGYVLEPYSIPKGLVKRIDGLTAFTQAETKVFNILNSGVRHDIIKCYGDNH